jgi:arylsulfatase A-like enzyme
MEGKPNIRLFITHDQGQFLGCYNTSQFPNSLKTPNLDKIEKDGIPFTNYFCTAPQCSPSWGSIQTSLYPHQNGLMGLTNRGWNLSKSNKTISMYQREIGHSTHLVGLQHETNFPETLGYDTMNKRVGDHKYTTKKLNNLFLEFLENHKNDEKPFYANFGIFEVHRPFSAFGEPVEESIVKIPSYLPEHPLIRHDLAEFYGLVEKVDDTISKIMEGLKNTGLYNNTLFTFTTDHGAPFPRAKCTLYDPGIKTITHAFTFFFRIK